MEKLPLRPLNFDKKHLRHLPSSPRPLKIISTFQPTVRYAKEVKHQWTVHKYSG